MRRCILALLTCCLAFLIHHGSAFAQATAPDDAQPIERVQVDETAGRLQLRWPMTDGEHGVLTLDKTPGKPLIESLAIQPATADQPQILLRAADPVMYLRVGIRNLEPQGWTVFFDNPPRRPHELFTATLQKTSFRIEEEDASFATVIVDGLCAGPFSGDLRFTVYEYCSLVHVQAVLKTERDACAILYDTGIASASPSWNTINYLDNHDQWHEVATQSQTNASPVAVRNRAIIAGSEAGSVAIFPPPHQYLYPLDFADNFQFVWHGQNYHGSGAAWGFGVRQPPEGDGRFVPWINAPPGTEQKLSVFYLLSSKPAKESMAEVQAYTRGDRFADLDGYVKFTSHYHIEHTIDYLKRQKEQQTTGVPRGLESPPFVQAFRDRDIDIVHLAEFHVRHTPEMNERRLEYLKTLHDECRRLSNDEFLLLPGEEPNVQLGGHWISFFPKPVYWKLHPRESDPFVEDVPGYGKVYSVGSPQDVLKLMEQEGGLMWTAHPRIKSSFGYPDEYRLRDFYLSDRFLGGAWKAMPADLSLPRLGTRCLDLLDDMANWGQQKYVLGEVDVFKVQPDYGLYGHMNVNYLKLDALPRFDDGWQSIVDALRGGKFFVTTGEVLIPKFTVNGAESGETIRLESGKPVAIDADMQWTFPPSFGLVVWGDGREVFQERIDLSDQRAFDSGSVEQSLDLPDARWVRFEAWDVAGNGAFTQPVWTP